MKESYIVSFDKNHTKFILCDCRSEILVIDHDPSINLTELAIFESYKSYTNKLSLIQRIRYALRILFNKYPYTDQIILNNNQTKDLIKFLLDFKLK